LYSLLSIHKALKNLSKTTLITIGFIAVISTIIVIPYLFWFLTNWIYCLGLALAYFKPYLRELESASVQ